jgi:4-amino-4-deoxy-L-arabinose transferase-like glycosyltransferase
VKQHYWWFLFVLLFGLTVRLHNLTYHSLWFDEAVSVHWSRQEISRILEVGLTLEEDRLPPLYYLTLKGWRGLAGDGEYAVRALSVGYGVLLVAVVISLGGQLFNRRVAVMVGLLAAVNPFLVWYSQEARMYAPAVFWGALAVLAWLHAASTDRAARRAGFGLLFAVAALAALYSHLYSAFLLPSLGLWTVIGYRRRWRLWLGFGVGGALVTLAYAPILWAVWRFSGEAVPGEPFNGLMQRFWWLLAAFTVWQSPLAQLWQILIPTVVALFGCLAFLPPTPGQKVSATPYPRLLVLLLLAMPFAVATLLLARNHLAFFGERYFIVMTPWLLLLAACGAERAGQWLIRLTAVRYPSLTVLPFAGLLVVSLLPLPGQWSIAASKEAWRQSVAFLANQAHPEDAILIHPDWVRYPFQYYFQGPGQTYAAFSTVATGDSLDEPLLGIIEQGHPVIWLVQSHIDTPDPERRVEQWLAARYPLVTEQYPPGITIKAFAPGYRLTGLPPTAASADITFANGMRLAGFETAPAVSATDTLFHPPSGWLHVTLYWQTGSPVSTSATPYVHLVGAEGVWGASLPRATDALRLFPPTSWANETGVVRHDIDVNLNPATPPGHYQLVVGLEETGEQIPLTMVEVR